MRKQLYGDNADERLVRRSWEGGEAASLVRRVAAASLPVELLAGPATLIGALCPHKVAHYHTATLSWTITLSQWIALSDYHKATLASPSHPDGGRQSRLRTSWTISSSTKNRPCKFWIHINVRQIHWLLLSINLSTKRCCGGIYFLLSAPPKWASIKIINVTMSTHFLLKKTKK